MQATIRLFFLALLAMASACVSAQDIDGGYADCDPYCIVFKQIGEQHFAIAVDASGAYVGMTAIKDNTGSVLATVAGLSPLRLSLRSPEQRISVMGAMTGCAETNVEVSWTTFETTTHIVTVIITKTYCDGELIDVNVSVITVRIPAPTYPGPN